MAGITGVKETEEIPGSGAPRRHEPEGGGDNKEDRDSRYRHGLLNADLGEGLC